MDNEVPDFSNAVDVVEDTIQTVDTPDFANSTEYQETTVPKDVGFSPMSVFANEIFKRNPAVAIVDTIKNIHYLKNNPPPIDVGETNKSYQEKIKNVLKQREDEKLKHGIGAVSQTPMEIAIGFGLVTHPVQTVAGVASFMGLSNIPPEIAPVLNLKSFTDKYYPNTTPLNKDIIELIDFGIKGGIIGKGIQGVRAHFLDKISEAGLGKSVSISSKQVNAIKDSINLLPEEKISVKETLGITDSHIKSSVSSGNPISVPIEKIMDLAEKPYWERTREEIKIYSSEEYVKLQKEILSGPEIVPMEVKEGNIVPTITPEKFSEIVAKAKRARELKDGSVPDVKDLQGLLAQKDISQVTMGKIRKFFSIDNIKKATPEQISKLNSFVADLKPEDKFLSDKQNIALSDIIKSFSVPEITPKRIIFDKFGEKEVIFPKGILSKVSPELIPTVNIKQGHPLITKIVNNARDLMHKAESEVSRRNEKFDSILTKAENSRYKLLNTQEKISRGVTPQNPEIFRALSGEHVNLTKEEAVAVTYLKNFFNMARKDLALDKYRKNYVTHMEKSLTEKILTEGLVPAIKSTLKEQKPNDLPVDIMLELDNIIGSEKFFKYAMERKGGLEPTTNLRQIVNAYSNLYETKMALDKILPEGQAVTQELLKGKSALWMKKFLQNLKGRGLDNQFKTGPMAWLAKVAEGVIDVGYIKMLGLNWKSAIKNVVAGESNSWIYQDFPKYLEGKKRIISNPKKVYKMAKEYGLLDGTYAEFAQKGIGGLKKIQDFTMIGQRAGEVEVRGSIFAGSLTKAEWNSGKVSLEKINEIRDIVAITQGIFSKVDSPLILQTWYGRMFFQMNRWRITNAMLMKDIIRDASVDIKAGNYKTQNVSRLGKMIVAYGTGMYISSQLYNAGYKEAGDIARNIANTVDGVSTLVTNGDLVKMFTDNPTLSAMKEIAFTIQELAYYLNIPGADEPRKVDFNKGVEDTYIAPLKTVQDIGEAFQ